MYNKNPMNELELLKKKIKYRAAYRGTKEMDLLLTSFVSSIINILSHHELKKLDKFLNCNDEDISNFYLNKIPIAIFKDLKILDLLTAHKIK
jgi:antitoxin CptB